MKQVGWQWDWAHLRFMLLPAPHPVGDPDRDYRPRCTLRSQVIDILSQEFIVGLRARELNESRASLSMSWPCRAHRAEAVMGHTPGETMPVGGSIAVRDRFLGRNQIAAPGRHLHQRDLPPCCRGTILSAGAVFRAAQLLVHICRPALDPRIKRADHGGYSGDEKRSRTQRPTLPAGLPGAACCAACCTRATPAGKWW